MFRILVAFILFSAQPRVIVSLSIVLSRLSSSVQVGSLAQNKAGTSAIFSSQPRPGQSSVSLFMQQPQQPPSSPLNVGGAAAGALAGAMFAGPVGAVIGFGVGDMLSAAQKAKQQNQKPGGTREEAELAATLASLQQALAEAQETQALQSTLTQQRRRDYDKLSVQPQALTDLAREFISQDNEAGARRALEQKRDVLLQVTKLEALCREEEARLGKVQGQVEAITARIAAIEGSILGSRVDRVLDADYDPIERRFRELEGRS